MLIRNRSSLRNQLLILVILIQVIILVLILYYLTHNFTEFYQEQLIISLKNESRLIVNQNQIKISQKPSREIDRWIKKMGREINTRITLIRKDGVVLADSIYEPARMDNHQNRPEIKEVLTGKETGVSIRKSDTLGYEMLYLATPVREKGELVAVVRLAKSLDKINLIIRRNIRNYLLFFLAILFITILIVWRITSNLIDPLSRLTRLAGKIASGNLEERITLKNYNHEIGAMAQMFNYMAEELKYKINEISAEKNKAEAILEGMVDGVIATDINRKVVHVNPAASDMFNLLEEKTKGKELIEIVRYHRLDQLLEEALANNTQSAEEITLKNPEQKILLCHFVPIISGEDIATGGIIFFTDITELRRLEQMRKDFVANVSHELRTPLTSIIGYVDTLIDSKINDPAINERFLKIIKTEADRLALLIKDLLNLSKVEQGGFNLKPEQLQNVIDKALEIVKEGAREKKIVIRENIPANLPLVLMIPEQIEQVLINLLDNSIKYTPDGGEVIVQAYAKGDKVFVEVEDNGIGIPAEDKERIFERFYRVDKARSRALGGTGIGLSIVKNIIQVHQSQIKVKSELGQGAIFSFYLHLAK